MHSIAHPIEMHRPAILHFGGGTIALLPEWMRAQGHVWPFVIADQVNAARLGLLGLGDVG